MLQNRRKAEIEILSSAPKQTYPAAIHPHSDPEDFSGGCFSQSQTQVLASRQDGMLVRYLLDKIEEAMENCARRCSSSSEQGL